jgi:hypothetical protein
MGAPVMSQFDQIRRWVFLVIGLGTLGSMLYVAGQYRAGALPQLDAMLGLAFHAAILLALVGIADRVGIIDLDRRWRDLDLAATTPDLAREQAWEASKRSGAALPALILPLPIWLVAVPAYLVVKWLVIGVVEALWLTFRIARCLALEIGALVHERRRPPPANVLPLRRR